MKLPEFSVRNSQFTLVLILLFVFIGIYSLMTMPRSEDPKPDFPNYTITVVYPGTGPVDMEEQVVDPIEEVLKEIDELDEIDSSIEEGLAIISIAGFFGVDTGELYNEIVREVNTIQDELPDGIVSLDIQQFDPNKLVSIHQVALFSETASYPRLHDWAEKLEYRMEQVRGINGVTIEAAPEEQIRIVPDFQRMARQNISFNQLTGILTSQNSNIPGGDVSSENRSFIIKTSGGLSSQEDIRNLPVHTNGSHQVYLKDIAEVYHTTEDLRWIARYKGVPAIYVTLTQKPDVNIVSLSQNIQLALAEFESLLPPDIELATVFEQAPAVSDRLNDFMVNLLQGVLLVGIVIFLFLGWRPALVVMLVIPVAIILAISGLDASDYALQQISIAALVIALGLLVDNGIVVVENIVRFRKNGMPLHEAAIKGTAEVGPAIISSTATTLFAFAPLVLLSSGAGEFLRSLPVTVMLVLSFSLILALTFTPILSGKILGRNAKYSGWISPFLENVVQKLYRPSLGWALRHPVIVIISAVLFLGSSAALFPFVGISFFPTADKPMLLVEVDTPGGSDIYETDRAVGYVSSVLDTTDFVRDYVSNTGHGNPTVYYNRVGEPYKKTHGQFLINFKEWDPPRFYQTLREFRAVFSDYTGADITFRELKNGPPFEAPIEIKVIGNDLDSLKRFAFDVEEAIRSTPGTRNVKNPLAVASTNLKVTYNRDKVRLAGVSQQSADLAVRAALSGLEIDEVTLEDGETYPLVIRMPYENQSDISQFDNINFTTRTGQSVPFRQVADLRFESSVSEIQHFNFQRSIAVTADVTNPDNSTAITEAIIEKLNRIELPDEMSIHIGGEYEAQQETFGDLGFLLILAMIGIFAVLVLQFKSIRQPLIIFSAVPMAVTGSFVALFITGWSFSFFAFVGFISLVGIVVNNSIILVDYSNQLMDEGKTLVEAITEGAEVRFMPIVLTTVTTIVGLLPLTLSQTSLWSPLGWTIIGGLITSSFLTLLVVPVLYQWFTNSKA
ncbi:MAG: AcrB/AcrD/AcrF family protein [Bacteroidetes bacterium]|jgi:multidrug efflux pump subunit AcrB|nr:AcrB/AcrD/AcrF family protein [Bacteroidota bacterium]